MSDPTTTQQPEWRAIGGIQMIDGKIVLPPAPAEPGLYRLQFDENTYYFGEAGNINRRLSDYHTPAQGVEAELRIHKALKKFGGASVSVLTGSEFATRSEQCVRENEEIKSARKTGRAVLNGGNIEEQIAFHESEIVRLRTKLAIHASPKLEANNDN